MKLGFIGLGIMGSPMAINLARAGHQLHVTTIGPVADELLSLGAVNVETARQLTEDMSSISPIETKRFAQRVNEMGADYLDAPVSGGEIGAREGTLSIMVGGEQKVFDRVKPLFDILGKNITLVGGNGDGQTCKVANQIIVALNIEAVSEALVFASKAGADPVRVRQALMGGFASCFKIALHQKDLNLALQSAKALALNLPNTATCQELFNTCAANGGSQLDHSEVKNMSETKKSGIDYWKQIVVVMSLGWVAIWIYRTVLTPIYPEIQASLDNVSNAEIGAIASFYFFAYCSMQIPCGILVDKFGQKIMLMAGFTLFIIGTLCIAKANGLTMIYIGSLMAGGGLNRFQHISKKHEHGLAKCTVYRGRDISNHAVRLYADHSR